MVRAARVHVAERGRDPRNYQLVLTGGGGPVHGYYVAKKLGLKRLIVPPSAGVASAFGLLVAPVRVDRVATIGFRLSEAEPAELEAQFQALEREAGTVIEQSGLHLGTVAVERHVDGRFVGQGFQLTAKLPPGPYDHGDAAQMRRSLSQAFEAAYREKFGRTPQLVPIEFTSIRVTQRAPVPGVGPISAGTQGGEPIKGYRSAYFPEVSDYLETPVYDRDGLVPGETYRGPALVEEEGSTLVVGPGARFHVARSRNIIVELA
jgi:N-methylhydantoinase A